jgi:hypothetical protein
MKVSKAWRARFESGLRQQCVQGASAVGDALTVFADSEELVRVPRHNAAGESAPTPLDDTAESLHSVSTTALPRLRQLIIPTAPSGATRRPGLRPGTACCLRSRP